MSTLVVVGAGAGVSGSVARRFARDGYDVALLGVDEAQLALLAAELREAGRTVGTAVVDVSEAAACRSAVAAAGEALGGIDVLHFNPSAFREKDPLELSVDELLADIALGVGALLSAVQGARPYLRPGARVTATGSMAADEPWHRAASLGVQKAGMRNLVRSIDATLRDAGVRAVSVTVHGALSREGDFTPDKVAEAIHAAAHQDEDGWRTEVAYRGG